MINRNLTTTLLNIFLGFALLIGLSPISNYMLSVETLYIDAAMTSQMVSSQGKTDQDNEGDNSALCCDVIAPFSIACAFLVPQCTYVGLSGGSERVGISAPLIQSIYIKAVIPPPKA